MKRFSLLFFMSTLAPVLAGAQVTDCPQFPAPCPHTQQISQATDFNAREQDNMVTPQEVAMESKIRNALTDILNSLARQKHWRVYELMESNYDRPNGSVSFPKWRATPYEKRPPHVYEISFIIIVNNDSLQAWRNWYTNDLQQQAGQVVDNLKSDAQHSANDGVLQSLTDSLTFYAQLSGKYTQDHYAEFMTAIQNNDQKGQKRYNDKMAWYQKKQEALMKKMQDHANGSNSASTGSYNNFASEKIGKTELFTNASLVLVHFAVNQERTEFGLNGDDDKQIIPQKKLNVPGAFYAGLLHNPSKPDGQSYLINEQDYVYAHPSNIGIILFGSWQTRRDAYNYSLAAYAANRTATDFASLKTTKCDAVQNLALQIEGRPDKITETLSGINIREIQKLLQ